MKSLIMNDDIFFYSQQNHSHLKGIFDVISGLWFEEAKARHRNSVCHLCTVFCVCCDTELVSGPHLVSPHSRVRARLLTHSSPSTSQTDGAGASRAGVCSLGPFSSTMSPPQSWASASHNPGLRCEQAR